MPHTFHFLIFFFPEEGLADPLFFLFSVTSPSARLPNDKEEVEEEDEDEEEEEDFLEVITAF